MTFHQTLLLRARMNRLPRKLKKKLKRDLPKMEGRILDLMAYGIGFERVRSRRPRYVEPDAVLRERVWAFLTKRYERTQAGWMTQEATCS